MCNVKLLQKGLSSLFHGFLKREFADSKEKDRWRFRGKHNRKKLTILIVLMYIIYDTAIHSYRLQPLFIFVETFL